MEFLKRSLLVFGILLFGGVAWAQVIPPTDPCGDMTGPPLQYVEKAYGQQVTVCFEYAVTEVPKVKFFRVRRSQTPSGAFFEYFRIPPVANQSRYWFQFTADRQVYLFVTTVWDEKDETGKVVATYESPGSAQIQVALTPARAVATPMASPEVTAP